MANERMMPPPSGKGRRGAEMMDEDPSTLGKLSKLAEMEGGGGEGEEGGEEEQSAQLVMSGAQQLMQAMQMNPRLEFIGQALQIIQAGIQQLAGGGGGGQGMEEGGGGGGGRRVRPPRGGAEEEAGY